MLGVFEDQLGGQYGWRGASEGEMRSEGWWARSCRSTEGHWMDVSFFSEMGSFCMECCCDQTHFLKDFPCSGCREFRRLQGTKWEAGRQLGGHFSLQTREWWFHRGATLRCDQVLDLLRGRAGRICR